MDIKLKNTKAYITSFMQNDTLDLYRRFIKEEAINRAFGGAYKLDATGDLANSLMVKIDEKGESLDAQLFANSYIESLDEGTGKHFPNIDALVNWIKRKPVTIESSKIKGATKEKQIRSLAFVIGRSIDEKGLNRGKPLNFLQGLYENRYKALLEGITEPVVEDAKVLVHEMLLEMGYTKKGNEYTLETK